MNRIKSNSLLILGIVVAMLLPSGTGNAQMDLGPRTESTYGQGLPRDRDMLVFADDQYPGWNLAADQLQYASIDGSRMKRQVIDLSQISIRYRDAGNKWWGRLPGTSGDRETMNY